MLLNTVVLVFAIIAVGGEARRSLDVGYSDDLAYSFYSSGGQFDNSYFDFDF